MLDPGCTIVQFSKNDFSLLLIWIQLISSFILSFPKNNSTFIGEESFHLSWSISFWEEYHWHFMYIHPQSKQEFIICPLGIIKNNLKITLAYLRFWQEFVCNIFIFPVQFALGFNIIQSLHSPSSQPPFHTTFFQHLTEPWMVMLRWLILNVIFNRVSRQYFLQKAFSPNWKKKANSSFLWAKSLVNSEREKKVNC